MAEPVLDALFLRLPGVAYVHDGVSPRLVQLSHGWPRLHLSLDKKHQHSVVAGEQSGESLLAMPAGPAGQRDAVALADDSELRVGRRVTRVRRGGRGRGGRHGYGYTTGGAERSELGLLNPPEDGLGRTGWAFEQRWMGRGCGASLG